MSRRPPHRGRPPPRALVCLRLPLHPNGGPVFPKQMKELEKAGLAKPYEMRARWHDRVSGTIEIRDGALQEPKMTWTRMPYETRIPWKNPRRAAAD